jgi:antitoxin HicB
MEYEYTVVIEPDEDGVYIATVPALPGCNTFGETKEEVHEMIKDAIRLYIEYLVARGEPIPQDVGTTKVRVPIPA